MAPCMCVCVCICICLYLKDGEWLLKNTDIYDYQFKEYGITGRHYASLIIDDINDKPQYKAAGAFVDGGGRDDGTQLGYLTVVVQNLLEEIDTLKERIDK